MKETKILAQFLIRNILKKKRKQGGGGEGRGGRGWAGVSDNTLQTLSTWTVTRDQQTDRSTSPSPENTPPEGLRNRERLESGRRLGQESDNCLKETAAHKVAHRGGTSCCNHLVTKAEAAPSIQPRRCPADAAVAGTLTANDPRHAALPPATPCKALCLHAHNRAPLVAQQ